MHIARAVGAVIALGAAATAWAQEQPAVDTAAVADTAQIDPTSVNPGLVDSGDTAWMLVSCALVLLMTPGLAFFYGGLVRRKNVLSVLMQCFTCMCLMTLLWVIVGYSLAFSESMLGGVVGNFGFAFLNNVGFDPAEDTAIPHQLFMIFQGMFAIITPALMIGAFAERMKFSAFCLFMSLWLLLVYCPVAHWVWGGSEGFFALGEDGALDFAGGTVVHINAGVAALVAAIMLGRRQGYPEKTSPPHHLPLATLGAGLLWFGWFGFNAGSAVASNESAVNAFVVTHISAAAAGLTWILVEWIRTGHNGTLQGRPTMLGMITGVVAGLVAITPCAGHVNAMGAIAVGIGAGVVAYIFVAIVKPLLGYDDSLDVFGVHGMAGVWGAIAVGLFATVAIPGNETDGLFYGNPMQVIIQLKAVIYTIVWSGVLSFVMLKVIDLVIGLRVSDHEERVGLDLTDHAEHAYTLVE